MTFEKTVTKVKKPVFNGNLLKGNSVKVIDNDYDVNEVIESVAGDIGPENIIGCVKSQGEWLITLSRKADCILLQQTGIILETKFVKVTGVTQSLLTVSLFGVPSYIDDYDLSAKLEEYGCKLKSKWTHRCYKKYPNIEDGTRYITLELASDVGSLPYVITVNRKPLKLMHNGQFRVCNLCLADNHLMRQCPSYRCRNCDQQGHTASRCPDVQCYRCGKRGHKSFHCGEPARSDASIPPQKSDADRAAIDRVKAMRAPTIDPFLFGATPSKGLVFGAPAAEAPASVQGSMETDGRRSEEASMAKSPENAAEGRKAALTREEGPCGSFTEDSAPSISMETGAEAPPKQEGPHVEPPTVTSAPDASKGTTPDPEATPVESASNTSIDESSTQTPVEPDAGHANMMSYAHVTKNGNESMEEGSPEEAGGSQPIGRRSSKRFDRKKLLTVRGSTTPQLTRLRRTVSSDDLTALKHGRSRVTKNSPHRPPNLSTARGFKPKATTPDT